MPDRDTIAAAAERIAPHVRQTPVLRLSAGELGPYAVAFKLEFLQATGSFKPRGAFNRLLVAGQAEAGVIAASGGNHGAAVAYAARALGMAAEIFVPESTPPAKCDRIASYGARLVRGGAGYAESLAASRARRAETGALEVHAYDDEDVVAGQGTVGMELEAAAPDLSQVLVATGGGGLIGGIAGWYGGRTRVVGIEPEGCPTLHAALAAGRPVPVAPTGIAADSLGAREAGSIAFAVARATGVVPVLVNDGAIREAQLWAWERLRIVVEPGGATALAALLGGAVRPNPGEVVGVVLCGANCAPGSVR